jgi:cell division protein FtsW (lipid II flippase)
MKSGGSLRTTSIIIKIGTGVLAFLMFLGLCDIANASPPTILPWLAVIAIYTIIVALLWGSGELMRVWADLNERINSTDYHLHRLDATLGNVEKNTEQMVQVLRSMEAAQQQDDQKAE